MNAQAVIYTRDFEPITVVRLSRWMQEHLKRHGTIRLAVRLPIPLRADDVSFVPRPIDAKQEVDIIAHRGMVNGHKILILTTDDEAEALLLDSAYLPGQRRQVNNDKANAFARGFIHALGMER